MTVAERLVAALRRDPALLQEVATMLAAVPRCGPWTPHADDPGAWFRSDPDGEVVAQVEVIHGRFLGFVRGDGEEHECQTLGDAFFDADARLEAMGWMLVPGVAWPAPPPSPRLLQPPPRGLSWVEKETGDGEAATARWSLDDHLGRSYGSVTATPTIEDDVYRWETGLDEGGMTTDFDEAKKKVEGHLGVQVGGATA